MKFVIQVEGLFRSSCAWTLLQVSLSQVWAINTMLSVPTLGFSYGKCQWFDKMTLIWLIPISVRIATNIQQLNGLVLAYQVTYKQLMHIRKNNISLSAGSSQLQLQQVVNALEAGSFLTELRN